jgi:aspartate racemase
LLCTNTMHRVYDAVAGAVSVPVLHIADVTARAVKQAYIDKVGLLGTAYTMRPGFYVDRLLSHGLAVVVPQQEGQQLVHRVIYEELCRGVVSAESRAQFLGLIEVMVEVGGARGVILGCTEIELLIAQEHTEVPLFPTTRLHVEAALSFLG